MSGTEIYKRTATYEREASTIRLHAPQWKLLLAFDGQRSVGDIAVGAGLSFSEALSLSETFLKREWISEQPITLEEYLKRATATGTFTGGVIPPSVVLNDPNADGKNETKSESVTPPALPSTTSASSPSTTPLSVARETARPARGPMRLAAVVDYIISVAETLPLGQLLAYRVFLRVPPEILQSEDIVSIHLVDDTSLVRSEPLQKAISAAVQEIVRRPLPDSVFSPA